MLAAMRGHWQTMMYIIKSGRVDVNATDMYGCSALHWTCESASDLRCVEALLGADRIDIDTKDIFGRTALMAACQRRDDHAIVSRMLAAGANVNAQNSRGRTALFLACQHGHLASIQAVLSHPDTNAGLADQDGDTALMMLVHEVPRTTKVCLAMSARRDALVNAVNMYGESLLSMLHDWDLVPFLIKRHRHFLVEPPGARSPYAFERCMDANRHDIARDYIMPRSCIEALLPYRNVPFVKSELVFRARWGYGHELRGGMLGRAERATVSHLLVLISARGFGRAALLPS